MALILSVTMAVMGNRYVRDEFAKKARNITEINNSIATMILEKKSAILSNSLQDMEYLFTSKADTFLSGDTQKFENEMLKLYDESFAKDIDIFFFRSVDSKYLFDASSPFYDTSRIVNYMTINNRFLQGTTRIIQSESSDGTLLAISGSAEAVSTKTGELAGYIFAGIILNNSSEVIAEIMDLAHLSEAAFIYGDNVVSGKITKSPSQVIENCYNMKDTVISSNDVSYCSDIQMENGGISLKFYQTLPDSFVATVNKQNMIMAYTTIGIVLVVTVIVGYLINLVTVRSLYRLVDYTKLTLAGKNSAPFKTSMIYEFNMLAHQLTTVNDDLTETQAYLRNMINNADAPMALWDSQGNITLFNNALEKLSGYEAAQVIGKHISHVYKIFPNLNVPATAPDSTSSSRFESEMVNVATEEHKTVVIWNITDVHSEGKHTGTLLQGIDVTEIKDAEEKMNLASKVFENTLDGMLIIDDKGMIVSCNMAFTNMTGYTEQELEQLNIDHLRSEKHSTKFYSEIWKDLYKYGRWSGEIWQRKKNGEIFPSLVNFSSIRNSAGDATNYISVIHDISERKSYEEHMRYQATHDMLTGLPNRLHFIQKLGEAIQEDDGIYKLCVLFMDIDRFKNLNDTLGHNTGDKVLQIIAERMKNKLPENAFLARFSGDEFGVLYTDLKNREGATSKAEAMLTAVAEPISISGYELFIQMSAGICFYPENGKNSQELLKNAEIAMYQAKQRGRNSLQHFTIGLDTVLKERLVMESKLNRAIENNELTVFYQPKINLADMSISGVEALLRWTNPELGSVPPDVFIPVAEDTGLILPIGEWVLCQSMKEISSLNDTFKCSPHLAVNLSLRQFMQKNLTAYIKNVLTKCCSEGLSFELEITESIFSEDLAGISKTMKEISELGVKFAIDDFGTGYSSIGYLKKMPISTLKIDKSYIDDVGTNSENESIVSSVILMAKSLGINVVAEGVETEEQLNILKDMGCNVVQGYYFAKPMPLSDLREFLSNWHDHPCQELS